MRENYDEVAWYARGNNLSDNEPGHLTGWTRPSGGIATVAKGSWRLWFKSRLSESHQHADLTHVSIRYRDDWLAVDPGTGTYNGPLEIRNSFRTSGAHNGLRVGDAHILTPHRAFRWLGQPRSADTATFTAEGLTVLFAAHDAFVTEHDTRVARAVVVSRSGIVCIDWLERSADSTLTVALAPQITLEGTTVRLSDATEIVAFGLSAAEVNAGSTCPFRGWYSPTYGRWEPAQWLTVRNTAKQTTAWGFYEHGSALPVCERGAWTVGSVRFSVDFRSKGVELSILVGGVEHLMNARMYSS
ncbi:heparinase II/III domain-containing protein [Pseudactinotalea sp. Z1748]|uniref:heparinase II/III domain-containing protein n=1 Tax=Pseudactinotalea sp. Z1748 TaxID=3413027 RepID=UPI003C7BCE4B